MKTYKLFIFAAIVLVSALSGCKKVESNITGQWGSVLMVKSPTVEIVWTFNDDGTLTRTYFNSATGDSYTDNSFYTVEKKLTKTFVLIDGSSDFPGYSEVDGRWQVEKFNDELMKLRRVEIPISGDEYTKDAAYLYREFLRQI
jgi:hypothetical protein